jgi:hypothetical protein
VTKFRYLNVPSNAVSTLAGSGTEITTDGAGTPTLLVFLAHWCPPG